MSRYGVFPGPYFPAFGLNTERYEVSLRIQSEYGKIRTRKNSVFGHISHSDIFLHLWNKVLIQAVFKRHWAKLLKCIYWLTCTSIFIIDSGVIINFKKYTMPSSNLLTVNFKLGWKLFCLSNTVWISDSLINARVSSTYRTHEIWKVCQQNFFSVQPWWC